MVFGRAERIGIAQMPGYHVTESGLETRGASRRKREEETRFITFTSPPPQIPPSAKSIHSWEFVIPSVGPRRWLLNRSARVTGPMGHDVGNFG